MTGATRRRTPLGMKSPNRSRAIIAPDKLREYLLNPAHRRGGSRAKLLLAMGFSAREWHVLERASRLQHLEIEVTAGCGCPAEEHVHFHCCGREMTTA